MQIVFSYIYTFSKQNELVYNLLLQLLILNRIQWYLRKKAINTLINIRAHE